jgi:hypothetical protein
VSLLDGVKQVSTHPSCFMELFEELATCRQSKCSREINRENADHGNHVINNIWINSLIHRTCLSPNVFFNHLFYGGCYPSLSPTHTVSHTVSLTLSLCCLALLHILIVWYKNPGIHFQVNSYKLFWYTSLFHLEAAYNNYLSMRNNAKTAYLIGQHVHLPL